MKKILFLMLLFGCDNVVYRDQPTAEEVYTVENLFTVDGCTTYRFIDKGVWHYYTTCENTHTIK
jgi:hypothetical protein